MICLTVYNYVQDRCQLLTLAGLDEEMVRADIRNQEDVDECYDQIKPGV